MSALELQGIFRESASTVEVESCVKRFESGKEVAWDKIENKHVVAGVLMSFLLQLPEPLIPYDLYGSFIAAEETVPVRDERASFIQKLLRTLPETNRVILQFLMTYLNTLTSYSDVNKMTAHNLAIVFGPALLRKEVETIHQMIADSPLVISSIRLLIEEYEYFFLNKDLQGEATFTDVAVNEEYDAAALAASQSSSDPTLFRQLFESEAVFTSFQDKIVSLLQLLDRNLDLSLADLEQPQNFTPSDIQLLSCLVNGFHSILDDRNCPEIDLAVNLLPNAIAENVTVQCRRLRTAFGMIVERVAERQSHVDQSAFLSQSDFIEANIVWKSTLQRMQEIYDKGQSLILSKKGSVDEHLLTVRQVIKVICKTIKDTCIRDLKADLAKQTHLDGAVVLSRLARTVIQALTEESMDHLAEVPTTRPFIAAPSNNPADRQRLSAITEVMEHAFIEMERNLTDIQDRVDTIFSVMHSRPLVQLLVAVKKYITAYLQSEPAAAPSQDGSSIARGNSALTVRIASDGSDPLLDLRKQAIELFNDFRTQMNSVMMEADDSSSFARAAQLAILAEKCRIIAQINSEPDSLAQGSPLGRRNARRATSDKRKSLGRVGLVKNFATEAFGDLQGFMFESKQLIAVATDVKELIQLSKQLKELNEVSHSQ